jgi:hypothetical protein
MEKFCPSIHIAPYEDQGKAGGTEIKSHQHLSYADDVNLLGVNIDTVKKNKEISTDAIKEVGLELHICCRLVTRMQGKIRI